MKNVKLKYFMRGLGCGIVFAVVLLVATSKGPTDEEIMKKAEKLGMVQQTEEKDSEDKLADLNADATTEPNDVKATDTAAQDTTASDTTASDTTEANDAKTKDTSTSDVKTEDTKTADTTNKDVKTEETKTADTTPTDTKASDTKTDNKSTDTTVTKQTEVKEVTFQVTKGMYSYTVASILEEKGIVKNAKDFDRFLIQNGYQDEIQSGTYTIKAGSSYESIAEAITK